MILLLNPDKPYNRTFRSHSLADVRRTDGKCRKVSGAPTLPGVGSGRSSDLSPVPRWEGRRSGGRSLSSAVTDTRCALRTAKALKDTRNPSIGGRGHYGAGQCRSDNPHFPPLGGVVTSLNVSD